MDEIVQSEIKREVNQMEGIYEVGIQYFVNYVLAGHGRKKSY